MQTHEGELNPLLHGGSVQPLMLIISGPSGVGKDALLKYEEAAQASDTDLKSRCIRPILVAGDVAVIRWVFEPSLHPDGKRPRGLRGADVLKAVEQGVNTLFNGRV